MPQNEKLFPVEEFETAESSAAKLYDQIVKVAALTKDEDIEDVIKEIVRDEETAWLLIEMVLKQNEGCFIMDHLGEELRGANRLEILCAMIYTQVIYDVISLELPPQVWLDKKYSDCQIIDPVGWRKAGISFETPIADDRFTELFNESDVTVPGNM